LRLRDLGSERFTWGDLLAIVRNRRPDSALGRALDPTDWYWHSVDAMLLSGIYDTVRWLQWAQSKDGQKNRNRPEPLRRPGVGPKKDPNVLKLPVDEVKRRLLLPRRPLRPVV